MRKIPIIIDCDPGVDDSYAIALANSHPEFELVALTAVEGNVPAVLTRYNCLCLRETFEMENTKVAYGATVPLVRQYFREISVTHGEGGVGGIQFEAPTKEPEQKEAWDVIYEEAVKHNGELVLFAVGPLTNIATCLRKYPDLPKYLKKFVIMGGGTFGNVSATGETAEFNIWVDPHAAKEVFEKLEVYMVGLNATHAAAVEEKDFDEMIEVTSKGTNKASDFLNKLSKFSKENSFGRGEDNNVIHDALAVAGEIDPEILNYKKYYIHVEDREVKNVGQTIVDLEGTSGKEPNCWIAMDVDQPKFVQMMKDMCKYYAEK
ncbi:MAG: nucleoside hydrolase [Oscillospiraceae bacterium]|nr:nucleoside hydrolase [Oscillospiraceae bacterium]